MAHREDVDRFFGDPTYLRDTWDVDPECGCGHDHVSHAASGGCRVTGCPCTTYQPTNERSPRCGTAT